MSTLVVVFFYTKFSERIVFLTFAATLFLQYKWYVICNTFVRIAVNVVMIILINYF